MGTRPGWLFATAALSATCWLAPGHVAGAGRSTIEADVIGALNPDGLMLRVIGSRRWTLGSKEPGPLSPYVQGGFMLAATPAFAKGAIALEWLPHPALQLIAESTWGLRLLLKPVLRLPLGPVLLRNVTQIAWLNFSGTGPYFLEWEYDTLLKDGDW